MDHERYIKIGVMIKISMQCLNVNNNVEKYRSRFAKLHKKFRILGPTQRI